MKPKQICSVDECGQQVHGLGFCNFHYARFKKGKSFDDPIKGKQTCSVKGCERKHHARGYCAPHRKRVKEGLELTTPIGGCVIRRGASCSIATSHGKGKAFAIRTINAICMGGICSRPLGNGIRPFIAKWTVAGGNMQPKGSATRIGLETGVNQMYLRLFGITLRMMFGLLRMAIAR